MREENKKINEEDYALIKAFLENDRNAFNRLVLKYKDMVFNLCCRILGDYDDANDCAQEAFIKVYRNLKGFKFRSNFSTWLYRIAVNTCKNEMASVRFRIRKKAISLDNPGKSSYKSSGDNMPVINIKDNASDPVNVYEKEERESMIQNAVNSLKGRERILVVLRDIEGKSYEEIAAITGMKLGTVKSKLARARQELRDILKGVI
jgi:RNA polymerase sigma-70 factor (ECF subfamily)